MGTEGAGGAGAERRGWHVGRLSERIAHQRLGWLIGVVPTCVGDGAKGGNWDSFGVSTSPSCGAKRYAINDALDLSKGARKRTRSSCRALTVRAPRSASALAEM